jgi:eukaryotic-like serine/threonine-protein kinase
MDDFTDLPQFWIGDLLVIPERNIVIRDGKEIKLEPRMMQVLLMLAEHSGETLSPERLLIDVWGCTADDDSPVYGDSSVSRAISLMRKAIGDDRRKPRYIETVSKAGYRLIPPVSLPENYRRMPAERWTKGSPYVGLSAFDSDHASVFCGRSRIIADLLKAMRTQIDNQRRFVLIVGASGCGKTSLLRAGAIPLLKKPGGFEGLHAVSFTTCDLAANGRDPIIPLMGALATWTVDERPVFPPQTPEQLRVLLTETPAMIEGFVNEAFRRDPKRDLAKQPYAHLLLTIDHAEALVATSDIDTHSRDSFAQIVQALCACPHVVVTMIARGDFYLKLIEALPVLAEYKAGDGHLDVMAPRYGEIGEIIRTPAWKADLSFETDPVTRTRLDDALRDAAVSQPDALPLLQHTLQTLYERRNDQRQLTFSAYDDIGGLEGAIAHRAEEVFASLSETVRMSINTVLARLIVMQPGSEIVTARRASIDTLSDDARVLVEAFVRGRLFVSEMHEGTPRFGVVHESLLRQWPRAAKWATENGRLLIAKANLQQAADRWSDEGRQDDHLLNPGRPLSEAQEVLAKMGDDLRPEDHALIDASSRSGVKKKKVKKLLVAMLAAFALVSATFAIIAQVARIEAENRRLETEREQSFMLDELARSLEHTGDLPLIEKISSRAILEYERRHKQSLSEGDQVNYSRALRLRGSVRMKRGSLETALSDFRRARDIASAVVSETDGSPDTLFELAQTEFWLGHCHREQQNVQHAKKYWRDYLNTAGLLRARDLQNPTWVMEESYAYNLLATLSYDVGDADTALADFKRSSALKLQALKISENPNWRKELADTKSWTGMTLESLGRLDEASTAFGEAIAELESIVTKHPDNKEWTHQLAKIRQLDAKLKLTMGHHSMAKKSIEKAIEKQRSLAESDPSYYDWSYYLSTAYQIAGETERALGDHHKADAHYADANRTLQRIQGEDIDPKEARLGAVIELGMLRNRDTTADTLAIEGVAKRLEALHAENPDDVHTLAASNDALLLLGNRLDALGNIAGARRCWQKILETTKKYQRIPQIFAARTIAMSRMHRADATARNVEWLARINYRHPDYLALLRAPMK